MRESAAIRGTFRTRRPSFKHKRFDGLQPIQINQEPKRVQNRTVGAWTEFSSPPSGVYTFPKALPQQVLHCLCCKWILPTLMRYIQPHHKAKTILFFRFHFYCLHHWKVFKHSDFWRHYDILPNVKKYATGSRWLLERYIICNRVTWYFGLSQICVNAISRKHWSMEYNGTISLFTDLLRIAFRAKQHRILGNAHWWHML